MAAPEYGDSNQIHGVLNLPRQILHVLIEPNNHHHKLLHYQLGLATVPFVMVRGQANHLLIAQTRVVPVTI